MGDVHKRVREMWMSNWKERSAEENYALEKRLQTRRKERNKEK